MMKSWFQSKTIWGGLIAVIVPLLTLAGFEITPEDQAAFGDAVTAIVTAAGGILAIYGRVVASKEIK